MDFVHLSSILGLWDLVWFVILDVLSARWIAVGSIRGFFGEASLEILS